MQNMPVLVMNGLHQKTHTLSILLDKQKFYSITVFTVCLPHGPWFESSADHSVRIQLRKYVSEMSPVQLDQCWSNISVSTHCSIVVCE